MAHPVVHSHPIGFFPTVWTGRCFASEQHEIVQQLEIVVIMRDECAAWVNGAHEVHGVCLADAFTC